MIIFPNRVGVGALICNLLASLQWFFGVKKKKKMYTHNFFFLKSNLLGGGGGVLVSTLPVLSKSLCEEQLDIILIMLYCVETFNVYCTDLAPLVCTPASQEKQLFIVCCSQLVQVFSYLLSAVVSWSRCFFI